jgi:transcription elongation GreA/GreB family factor
MTKEKILHLIVDQLSVDLAILFRAARTAHAASIHEENVPDNEYDTLGLEASYLAQAQANRAQEIRAALSSYRSLPLQHFDADSPIRLTALVTLQAEDGGRKRVFVGPQAGGLKVRLDGDEIIVITPHSPVGRALLGKTVGDAVGLRSDDLETEFEIIDVC